MSEPTKTSIGSYTITGQRPGPGGDYYATSPEGTRVLVRQFEAGEALAQVRQEVTVCASLEHPAVARTIDSFEVDGKLALVFEHFEGASLSQITRRPGSRQLLSDAAIWLIAYEVTGALGQAHSASDSAGDLVTVCHGHLSADCVLVSPSGQLRLEGLGLAALVGSGQLSAAPGFQAPEQAKGGRVTPRGDLYSAAVLLWAMLSGKEPKASVLAPSLSGIIDRVPSELRESLERALQPSVGKRKITAMELEQALGEVVDEAAGRQALSGAAGSAAPSRGAQADTGPAMLGLMGRPTARSEPDAVEAGAPPADAARPAVGQSPAAAKAKAIGARARKSSVRSRQKTLLGAFGAPKPAAPAGVPRQAVARKAAEGETDGSGAEQVEPAVKPAAAPPEPPPSSRRPPLPSSRRPPPSSRRGASKPLPPRARESAPGRADGVDLPPRRSKPPKVPSAAGAAAEPEAPESAEPPTVERVLEVEGGGGDVQAEQAIEEMILGATVGAEAGSPTDRPPVLAPGIDDLIAEPLATGKAPTAAAEAAEADAVAPGPPAGAPSAAVGASPGPGPSEPAAAEPDSPWHAPAAPSVVQPGPAERPLSIGKMVLIALGTAVVVIVLGVWWTRRQVVLSTDVPIPEAPSAAAAAPPTATPATSAPSAQPTTSAAATVGEDAGPDPSTLPRDKGLLRILFDGPPNAEVFRFGKSIGKVGEPLEIPCGRAFLRVGKAPGPSWLSAGASVDVKCQALTEATVEPL